DAFEAEDPMQTAVDDVGEPLPCVPGGAGFGEGIQVLIRNSSVVQDVFTGSNVPAHVGIGEQTGPTDSAAADEEPDQDGQKEEIRERGQQQARPAALENGFDGGRG